MAEKEKIFTKGNIITIIICVVICIITLIVSFLINNDNLLISNNSFKIDSFTLNTETTDYKYTNNYTDYDGEGIITCWDKNNSYYVLIEVTDKANNETNYITTIVSNGEGKIHTYDTTATKVINKPDYNFKVVGFIPFKK